MTLSLVCIALLGALVFLLGANVSRMRSTATSQLPTALDDPLYVAVRAHGNAAEYVPALAVLALIVGLNDPAIWMQVAIVVATVARYVHAFGVLLSGDMGARAPLREIGAVGTYLSGLVLVAAVLVVA